MLKMDPKDETCHKMDGTPGTVINKIGGFQLVMYPKLAGLVYVMENPGSMDDWGYPREELERSIDGGAFLYSHGNSCQHGMSINSNHSSHLGLA